MVYAPPSANNIHYEVSLQGLFCLELESLCLHFDFQKLLNVLQLVGHLMELPMPEATPFYWTNTNDTESHYEWLGDANRKEYVYNIPLSRRPGIYICIDIHTYIRRYIDS